MPVETIIEPLTSDEGRGPSSLDAASHLSVDDKTLTEAGFYWREREGVKVLVCKRLEEAGFVNGFSTRLGGVSNMKGSGPDGHDLNLAGFDEDLSENIYENRHRFLKALGTEALLATAWQMHGDGIKIVRSSESAMRTEERFDALVSGLERILIGVRTADCVPILVGDPKVKAFAAIHAGWRGTSLSIAEKAVKVMADEFACRPKDLIAAVGPHACARDYEIGEDVMKAFDAAFSTSGKYFAATRPGHALVDLALANRDQLTAAGIPKSNISTAPLCTMERTDLFFSYRIERKMNGKTGRLLSVIGIKDH